MNPLTRVPVGIVGASGYSGIEATRILARHPHVELTFVSSDKFEGQSVQRLLGLGGEVGALKYVPQKSVEALAAKCRVVLLATPAEVSLELAPKLLAQGVRVVDLSGAFRLQDPALYPKAYGFAHHHAALLPEAVYGMPELSRARIADARLVANPGCYPTVSVLGVLPFLKAGLVEEDSIIIDAASGVTGAGRKATEEMSFTEVNEDFRAYKVLKHQHTPEIAQALSVASGAAVPVVFTPHLLPVKRGILATIYARLKPGVDPAQPAHLLGTAWRNEAFVTVVEKPEDVNLKTVVGTNRVHVGVACEGRQLVACASMDNLVKGAAGQAVQNLNLMMGWDEGTALTELRGFYP
ncbi:MAG: N-acetyl-gamma-glutamyl-phosphate reductase [Myxococcales bacterium]